MSFDGTYNCGFSRIPSGSFKTTETLRSCMQAAREKSYYGRDPDTDSRGAYFGVVDNDEKVLNWLKKRGFAECVEFTRPNNEKGVFVLYCLDGKKHLAPVKGSVLPEVYKFHSANPEGGVCIYSSADITTVRKKIIAKVPGVHAVTLTAKYGGQFRKQYEEMMQKEFVFNGQYGDYKMSLFISGF